jgi:histidine triad (HIT) family protein
MTDDFYCDEVLSGRTPVQVVAETPEVLAYRHTRPAYPVHIVVIPRRHIASLVTLTEGDADLILQMMAVVRRVAEQVLAEYGAARVLTNLGAYQESKHLHWHVLSGEPWSDSPQRQRGTET